MREKTISSTLREAIIEVTSDYQEHNRQNMIQQLSSQKDLVYGRDFKESHFAGALNILAKKGILEPCGKGTYRLRREAEAVKEETEKRIKENASEEIRESAREDTREDEREDTREDARKSKGTREDFKPLQEIKCTLLSLTKEQYGKVVNLIDQIDLSALSSKDAEDLRYILECKEMYEDICQKLQ